MNLPCTSKLTAELRCAAVDNLPGLRKHRNSLGSDSSTLDNNKVPLDN